MADMVAGDTNRTLRVTCTFPASITVTGATASLYWRITTTGGKPGELESASMTNLTPSSGSSLTLQADYLFAAGELLPGRMEAEVRVTIGGLVITSDDTLTYDIRARV